MSPGATARISAIDWLRGLVIVLMTVDHAGVFNADHFMIDSHRWWVPGSPIPPDEFLTRWVTHLCAPTFVMLAGVSLALSAEKRRHDPGLTRFIATRGLLIAALDPLWMSLAFMGYQRVLLQVLYAIGLGMICMAFLRRYSSRVLLVAAIAIQLFAELAGRWQPPVEPLAIAWKLLVTGGPIGEYIRCPYPILPWLSVMMAGWVLGRWLLEPRSRADRARTLALVGVALLAIFLVVRGIDGYGNWRLHRDSLDVLQWLHVSKYPLSISFVTLELGIAFLLFAAFVAIDDPTRPRRALAVLSLFGATALFYYVLHAHLLFGAEHLLGLDPNQHGLAKAWIAALLALALLAAPCAWYRRYKRAHPDGWTRFL